MPLPIPDVDSAPFWAACSEGELRLQRCRACGAYRYPPGPLCRMCHAFEADWVRVTGRGRVYSWIIAHHPVHPAVQDRVPYNVVVVELDEGPRMVSNLIDVPNEAIRAGLQVEVVFRPIADGVLIPQFVAAAPRPSDRP